MWILLALALACEAHVHLIHSSYFTYPIRNAPTVSADGTLSTAGPCGGVLTWGNKTYTQVTPGQNVSFTYAYNGGHQSPTLNMLRVAMNCGKPETDLDLANSTVAPTFSPLVNASTSSTLGYHLWVIIPAIPSGMNGAFCTISGLDVRNWGGCFDVEIVAASTPTPATNALTGLSVGGVYTFGEKQCTPDSPNCCCVSGTLQVQHITGATSATGTAELTQCNTTTNGTLHTIQLIVPVTLTQTSMSLASLKGTVTAGANSLSFLVSAGTGGANTLIMTDDTSPLPYYCGLNSNLYAAAGTSPTTANNNGGNARTVGSGIAAVLLALLFFH